jgi:hypothetical protein
VQADRAGSVKSYGDFLRAWPAGAHAGVAGQRRARRVSGARERLVGAGAGPALLALFEAWTAAGKPVPVVVEDEYAGPAGAAGDLLVPWTLLEARRGTRETQRYVRLLGGLLAAASRSPDLQLIQAPGSQAQRPFLKLRLAYDASGEEYAPDPAAARRAVALGGTWTLELGPAGTREVERIATGRLSPPATVRVRSASWSASATDAAARVYGVMLDDIAQAAAGDVARALGLQPGRGP